MGKLQESIILQSNSNNTNEDKEILSDEGITEDDVYNSGGTQKSDYPLIQS